MSRSARASQYPASQPGNLPPSVTHGLDIGVQVGTYGPEHSWKIYSAVRDSDLEAVSVFVFEKRLAEKLHKPKNKGNICELYKRGWKQLERLQQQIRFLKILRPLEETPDALIVVTEPVLGSLHDLIRHGTPIQTTDSPPAQLEKDQLLDLEIKCGICHITEALIYLHTTEHSMHGNICPESILVTSNGAWKLAGMEFLEKSANRIDSFPSIRWSSKYPKLGQPNLEFMAPEVQQESQCSTTSDMFSLGMTVCAIYNNGRSLLQCQHSSSNYDAQLAKLDTCFREFVTQMPAQLQEAVNNLLNHDPCQRPTAKQFSMTKCLNEAAITCLRRLDYLDHMFPSQKAEFFPALRDALPAIPRKMWLNSVLPALLRDLSIEDQPIHALTPLCYMIEHSDKMDYRDLYRETIQRILDQPNKPLEDQIVLLHNLPTLARFASSEELNKHLIPVLECALQASNIEALEATVQSFSKVYPILRDEATKLRLYQGLKALFKRSSAASIKMQPGIIAALHRLSDHLSKSMILEEVLPLLADERLIMSSGCVAPLIELYRQILKDPRLSIGPEQISRFLLPTALPLLTTHDLSKETYQLLETFCKELFGQLEKKQRAKHKLETVPSSPCLSIPHPASSSNLQTNRSNSANNSRRSSVNDQPLPVIRGIASGGPHIVFTAGDCSSAHSSRSSSPGCSRRSSYTSYIAAGGMAVNGGSGSRKGSMFLNVGENGLGNKLKNLGSTSPDRRGSFFGMQTLNTGNLSPTQRRHSAVNIQALGSQVVSLFAGRT